MSNYADLKKNSKVADIQFVGAGVAVVTLNKGFGNPNKDGYHSEQQSLHAYCYRVAQEFVEGAEASSYASYPGGGSGRVKAGTPLCLNPQSETYWSM